MLSGPAIQALHPASIENTLQIEWRKIHLKRAGFEPEPLHIDVAPGSDEARIRSYLDKFADVAASATFQKTF